PVESSKSYGSGSERSSDVPEVGEGLEPDAAAVEIPGEPVDGEHSFARQCGAAVGVSVADVDHGTVPERCTLARLAALGAHRLVPPQRAPAVGPGIEPVGEDLEPDHSFALEHGLDQ